jgi:phenylpropionate dioxygenase-like ring-hydroxylating dioxygenase large terminal subunit
MQQAEQSDAPPGSPSDGKINAGQEVTGGPFLRNIWYVAGWSSEFNDSKVAARTVADTPLALYRKRDGSLVALADRCAHRWAPLSLGRIEGDDLRCMYHGLKFGPDGRCLEIPRQNAIAKSPPVTAYPSVERHRFVWVWMGDAARADPDLIPDLGMLDQPGRRILQGFLDYEAHYLLICDNLLDLSHLGFLHEKTLGRPVVPSSEKQTRPRIPGGSEAQPLGNGVRVEGWLSGKSAFLPKGLPDGDFWSRVDFLVPGIYRSEGRMYAQGTAEVSNGSPPAVELQPLFDGFSIQAVTPATVRKTRYFYSTGHRTSDMEQEEADAIWAIVLEAFSEDLAMIQAQQRTIDLHPGHRMGGIAADRGVVLFRKSMQKLIADETAEPLERHPQLRISAPTVS